jgi:RNA polymerase sigma-70 factor (ECF subfamily)
MLLRRHRRTEERRLRAYARTGVDRWVDYTDEADARLQARRLGPQIAAALNDLRPRERDALFLYALADLSYEEVALALDAPIGTVRTLLHRARQVAQERLGAPTTPFPLTRAGADLDERPHALP